MKKENVIDKTFRLANGYKIPTIGFGTWRAPEGETTIKAVKKAIECGYTHIDCAASYQNEMSVGLAIKKSGISRDKLFVTSKFRNPDRSYEKTVEVFEKTLKDLQFDYLDLYLIHWPANRKNYSNWEEVNSNTWKALEDLYRAGRIKAIGVSNFLPHHLEALMRNASIMPMVNQIEYHPGYMQQDVIEFCNKNNICVEAWSPIGSGRILENDLLIEMARKYKKSVAQICIRWCMQNSVLPLPKSVTASRIEENLNIYDFVISDEDMYKINNMGICGYSGNHPDEVNF